MAHNIHPCFWYNGNARAAADFYCSLFPNSSITIDNGMVVNFELAGQKFMGLNGGPQFNTNPSISMFVTSEADAEIDELWVKLSEGGKIMMALGKYPWSEYYGFVEDKFGLSWQLYKGNYSGVNQKIVPCFLFVNKQFGRAEEALKLYTGLFPQSEMQGIAKYAATEPHAGTVKHSQFVLDGKVFMAMDGSGEHAFDFNEGISLLVECENQEQIDHFWNGLTANGGQESMCGWLKDPFGVSWQIVPKALGKMMSDPAKTQQVMNAFLKMKKFDVAALEAAYND